MTLVWLRERAVYYEASYGLAVFSTSDAAMASVGDGVEWLPSDDGGWYEKHEDMHDFWEITPYSLDPEGQA